jgi:hypothetical protein
MPDKDCAEWIESASWMALRRSRWTANAQTHFLVFGATIVLSSLPRDVPG